LLDAFLNAAPKGSKNEYMNIALTKELSSTAADDNSNSNGDSRNGTLTNSQSIALTHLTKNRGKSTLR
jgi:hypothetical protein